MRTEITLSHVPVGSGGDGKSGAEEERFSVFLFSCPDLYLCSVRRRSFKGEFERKPSASSFTFPGSARRHKGGFTIQRQLYTLIFILKQ